ncbi:hypothetical protein F2P44_27600 [Massilia sp. CCM 8695]|uniref:Pilus assembly protein n=1 Tax=Massilia frigida TaxID=2609281 RepID=A0ABX0NCH0_9BURK|nr:hypothetical protein [Massilia frigida]NHZ83013.1 hypothetical protein [Massilia frigida]
MNQTIYRAVLPMLAMLAGCATAPRYDARFGDAVRQARSAMTINPQAAAASDAAAGIDGQAARDAMLRYQDSFKAPPPVITVINAGGPAAR